MGRRPDPKPRRNTVTRYETSDGRRCSKSTPGAIKKTTTSETYYVEFPPRAPGEKREKISLKTSSEQQAWKALRELLERRARQEAGLDTPLIRAAVKPIVEHVADWARQLRNGGRTSETQVKLVAGRMTILSDLAGWQRLPQITRDSALEALSKLTTRRARGMPAGFAGRSAQTRNHYLTHLKQFVTWCVEEGRLDRDLVGAINPVDVASALRHPRRSPSDADVGAIMSYLEGTYSPPPPDGHSGAMLPLIPPRRCKMTGPQRGLGYRVCMATGFRAKELRTLTRASFDLDAGTVRGKAAHVKNKKETTTNLPAWLAEELKVWFGAGGGTWETLPKKGPGRLLRLDQEACGVVYVTDDGFFDFHSLRHWFMTWAANRPNISPKTLQTMARHSDPRLTLKTYAKAQNDEIRKVVDQLPRPGGPPETSPGG